LSFNFRTGATTIRKACALLFPIDWPEPFGLVMFEPMASGAPVLVLRRGSVPDVVGRWLDRLRGGLEEATSKVNSVLSLERRQVRRRFGRRFTAERMAQDYLKHYSRLIGARDSVKSATSSLKLTAAIAI